MSVVAPMLVCPEKDCTDSRTSVGALTAHLVNDHLIGAPVALERARKVQSQADPFGLDANGIKKRIDPPPSPAAHHEEPPMATKSHGANPAACQICARLAKKTPGAKCKRHGGPDHSTAYSGVKRRTPPTGLPAFESAMTFLDTQITAAEERLTKLKAAREGMAMLVDATRA